ncbi:MAG: hypothetical protein LBV41_07940 [Cytophagaceae bacterium]|jgi:hypothetical protein|nr:hypothetical protein [Cytophagaceae bacterium]
MRLASIILLTFIASGNIFSQTKTNPEDRKTTLDIGFFMGGGSLVEIDTEFMLTKQFGL